MPSSQKLQIWLKPNCTWMFIRWSSTNFRFFVPVWNSNRFPIGIENGNFVEDLPMIIPGQFGFNCPSGFREEAFWNIFPIGSNVNTTAGHRLTLDSMGKYSNAFFSETTNMIKAKLYMNVHWMVLYNLKVFCSDMKFKMAATAGLSLTLDPMGAILNFRSA
jgi:hypothetical protein